MKTDRAFPFRCLTRIAPLFFGASLVAAPLTWFPGPSLDAPISGAATTVIPGGDNLLIGGDSYYVFQSYPQSLGVTNVYWTYLPAMYGVRIAPGAVANGGIITVYGGSDGTNSTSTVIGYSPSGDATLTLASMSVARSDLGYAADRNGYAYAIGGLDDGGQPLSSAERYNPDSDTWSAIANLPTALSHFPAVFDGTNSIYTFGGLTNTSSGTEAATVLRYSVSANTWTAMAPMPIAVAGSAASLGADGKIYVGGGASEGVTPSAVQVYNPGANSWVISTPLPESLSAAAMGVDSLGRLILLGGMDANGNDVSDVWRSQQLGAPDSAPDFVLYPSLSGTYQVPYVSSINATGNPQPTFLLLSGPAGMQVDPYSGAIAWTPQAEQIGSNPVSIRATNYAGYADWSFTITVPNPPPTIPTNLNVVGVTDNSVTLSWSPESPVVGPATYSVYLRHSIHDPKGSGSTVWYTQIGSTTTLPTITITGLTPGLAQAYYVVAAAARGTTGYGPGILATSTAPQGPPDLFVTGLTSTTVSLAWDPAPGPAQNSLYSPIASYTIMERNAAVSPAVNIPTVANITGTSGTITGLTPGRSHIWFVSGVDAAGNASPLSFVYVVVTNPVPVPPRLSSVAPSASGGFQITASEGGSGLQTVLIQAATNPADPNSWVQIGSLLPTANPFTFTDSNAAQYPMRFYRIVAP
jgi:Kelch motif